MNKMKVLADIFLLLVMCMSISAQNRTEESKCVNIVFIGNSITQGVLLENPRREAPPVQAAIYLKKKLEKSIIRYSNNGVSGCTTFDYLPETNTLFPKMQQAADQFADESWATLVFSIMLGTNDSACEGTNGAPVSKEQYEVNMKKIIDRLLALYPSCKIVLHKPLWYSENTHNSARYLSEGLGRLGLYSVVLDKLVNDYSSLFPDQIYIGDTKGYDYFKSNCKLYMQPENGKSGVFHLHPNKEGAKRLGEFWGNAILKVLK